MIDEKTIKQLKENSAFIEFQAWIGEKIDELNSLDGLEKISNEEAGEEVKIRAKTVTRLKEIFDPIFNFQEKKEIPFEKIQARKDQVGL